MNYPRYMSIGNLPRVWPLVCSWLLSAALLLAAPAVLAAADSDTDAPRITSVQVGLGGKFKVGYWTPAHVSIEAGNAGFEGSIEFVAADDDLRAASFVTGSGSPIVQIPPQGNWSGWQYFKLGRTRAAMRVVLRNREGNVVDQQVVRDTFADPSTWQWVVTVGADVGVDEAAVFLARVRDERLMSSRLTGPEQFPDQWFGYEGVNVLLVPTGDVSHLERLSEAQFDALLGWLRQGGRLVLAAGHRAPELFRAEHRFHTLRPGEFLELDVYWKASGLENFARTGERVRVDESAPLAVFSGIRGRALCLEGAGGRDDRPMVMHYPYGFGDITYIALDLDRPPLSTWTARPRLLARLLKTRSDEEDSAMGDETLGQVTHVGFDDISGQLRAALDQFPGVTLVQFSWVAGLLVIYIILLGPVDFFGLRKLRRPQWTWITFPLIVLLFCGLAVYLAHRWKGTGLQVNQVDVVDVDASEKLLRGTTWASVYSASASTLDVDLAPAPALATRDGDSAVLLSWQGLPGTGLGGMNSPAPVEVSSDEYRIRCQLDSPTRQQARVAGLSIDTSSTKGLLARWTVPCTAVDTGELVENESGMLEGTVVNPTDVDLSWCRVFYANWSYPLERLASGESVRLGDTPPVDLSWQLNRRRVVGSRDVSVEWNRSDLTDMPRIVEMLMFYGAAGGRAYTGLTNNYQAYVDLSRHLRSGQAILVGRCNEPASHVRMRTATFTAADVTTDDIMTGDKDQHWTFYRILLPVKIKSQR